jgi:hypothetical protein
MPTREISLAVTRTFTIARPCYQPGRGASAPGVRRRLLR